VGITTTTVFEDLFCTYFGQNRLYRNNGDGTFTDVTRRRTVDRSVALGRRLQFPRLQTGRASGSFRPIMSASLWSTAPVAGENVNANWKGIPVECGPRGAADGQAFSLSQQCAMERLPTVSQQTGVATASESYGMTVWPPIDDAGHLRCLRFHAQPALHEQSRRHFPRRGVMRGLA